MSSTHSHVVVGFDFSHSGRAALNRAIALAKRAPLHVLHFVCVIEPHTPIPAVRPHGDVDYRYAETVQCALTEEVEHELRDGDGRGRVHFYVHTHFGRPADEILRVARDVGAELIIVGSKGLTGLERLIVGSVSEQVVRLAGCTVEVARPRTYHDVDLLHIIDVEPHTTYVPPHRYCYEDQRLNLRPPEWPLY